MAPRKENVQVEQELKVSPKTPGEKSFIVRCRKMEKLLSEQFPQRADEIKKIFSAMSEFDPAGVARVLKQDFLDIETHRIGDIQKSMANDFAKEMGQHLDAVRAQGITSTRKIAEKFNELGIKSKRGGLWYHSAVSDLIQRRRQLGLE